MSGQLGYATYFDQHYLTRGLALYQSLVQHSPPFRLWVLCLDRTTEKVLSALALPNVELVSLSELEKADPALLEIKPGRTKLEYYWTLTSAWLAYLLDHHPRIDLLTYLDADLFFFGDPTPIYEELGSGSILVMPMRYTPYLFERGTKSRFNVGFNVFRRDEESLACLAHWRSQCLDWCYNDRSQPGRFGDQKYLDEWPERYAGFIASANHGAGLAPWNLGNYRLRAPNGRLMVDNVPVISFHFSELRIIRPWLYEPIIWSRRVPMTRVTRYKLCLPYARALRRAARLAQAVGADVPLKDPWPRSRWKSSLAQMLRHRTLLVVTDFFVV